MNQSTNIAVADHTTTVVAATVVDIVSIGSLTRPNYLQAQQATFGKHPSVRHFWGITEEDDLEQDCNDKLTLLDVQNITAFCRGPRKDIQTKNKVLYGLKRFVLHPQLMEKKPNQVGWLCAQKRPMVGFYKALQQYKTNKEQLPDFFIIMDDDTYYNMNQVVPHLIELQQNQLAKHGDSSMVLTGCLFRVNVEALEALDPNSEVSNSEVSKWFFPYGGFGTIFSKEALQSLIEPLDCLSHNASSWSKTICPELQKDRIGEYQLYKKGMSLVDIMYRYTFKEPYTDHKNWKLGFCVHSDWVWGYFVNYYNISVPMGHENDKLSIDRIGAYKSSQANLPPERSDLLRQCKFKTDENCDVQAHMCHYITPDHMEYLWSQQLA